MRLEDYPPQEPLSPFAAAYQAAAMAGAVEGGEEIAYGPDPSQRLLFFPAPGGAGGPTLLFLHGGGWTNGYKEWMTFMAPAMAAHGIAFATAGYRLAPRHVHPAAYEDAAAAAGAAARRIGEGGGDPAALFIGGHSAGGHLAALVALRRAAPVRGALPISGTYYFTEGSGLSVRPRFLGAADSGAERDASPMTHVAPGAPPMLLAEGDRDFPHLKRQAEEFAAAMRAAGNDVERIVLPDSDHGGASLAAGLADGPWAPRAAAWMRERHQRV